MNKFFLYMALTLLTIMLVGCAGENNSSDNQNKESTQDTDESYDIAGTVQEISEKTDTNKILLTLSKQVQNNEKEMQVMFGESTTITSNQGEGLTVQEFKSTIQKGIKLHANLTDTCLDTEPRTCTAEEIAID